MRDPLLVRRGGLRCDVIQDGLIRVGDEGNISHQQLKDLITNFNITMGALAAEEGVSIEVIDQHNELPNVSGVEQLVERLPKFSDLGRYVFALAFWRGTRF